jgi:hypothetical protein
VSRAFAIKKLSKGVDKGSDTHPTQVNEVSTLRKQTVTRVPTVYLSPGPPTPPPDTPFLTLSDGQTRQR